MGYYMKLIGGYKFYLTDDRKRAVPGSDIPGTALCVVKKYNVLRIISECKKSISDRFARSSHIFKKVF